MFRLSVVTGAPCNRVRPIVKFERNSPPSERGFWAWWPPMRHGSDCAVNHGPALPAGPCDCGGLDLAAYGLERFSVAHIPSTGRLGFFIDLDGRDGFVEVHELPPDRLVPRT